MSKETKKEKKPDCPECKKGHMKNISHNFDGNTFKCDKCGYKEHQIDPFDVMF